VIPVYAFEETLKDCQKSYLNYLEAYQASAFSCVLKAYPRGSLYDPNRLQIGSTLRALPLKFLGSRVQDGIVLVLIALKP
jgi:hypothetical protein